MTPRLFMTLAALLPPSASKLARDADAARDAGDFAEAARLYDAALARRPRAAALAIQCGNMLKEIGRLKEAEQRYAQAARRRPADADLALQRGHARKLAGDFLAADRFYAAAAAGRPAEAAGESATLRENGWSGAPPLRTMAAVRATLAASGLITEAGYRALNPDADLRHLSALDHYLMVGARERRRPHPLFDTAFYLGRYPAVGRAAGNPLDDFLRAPPGTRDPHPLFDAALYVAENPDAAGSGMDVVSHYQRIGAPRGARPSPRFDPAFYSAADPDVAATGLEPLAHYVLLGNGDGRRIHPAQAVPGPSAPVTAAALRCLKAPLVAGPTALLVAHAPRGRLKPHVRPLLEALRRQGLGVVLVAATDGGVDRFAATIAEAVADVVAGLFVRDNGGWDFAAWAHVWRAWPALREADSLLLTNDSLFGPTGDAALAALLDRARRSPADLVGLTEHYERARHIQSYFLLLKPPLLRSAAFDRFMREVVSFADKDDVIFGYECTLARRMAEAGFATTALFDVGGRRNPTIFRWRALLEAGFPFLKVGTVRDAIPGADASGWRDALAARGYDTRLVDATLRAAAGQDG